MRILLRPKPKQPIDAIRLRPTAIRLTSRPLRVLDFDIENRPLSYLGSDFTTGEVTAVSWAWTDRPQDVTVKLLGDVELPEILHAFCRIYEQADVVTGHYIRGHDLPMLNGALMEFGMPALGDIMTQDTKLDLMRSKGLSLSQESLAAMFRLDKQKVQMNQVKWRAANRLTKAGLALVRERVVGDVRQHIELRQHLLNCGYLGPARVWKSRSHEPLAPYAP